MNRNTSRNWPKCNHSICDCIWLIMIYNYFHTLLWLWFLMLVIFMITLQLVCDYFDFHPSMWTTLIWFSSKKNNLCHISCKCDQFSHNPIIIQRCILCITIDIVEYIKIYKCIFWMYMNSHITCVFKDYY
jgi:hypothetical protein